MPIDWSPPKKGKIDWSPVSQDTGTVLEEEHELVKPHRSYIKGMHPATAARFLQNLGLQVRGSHNDYEFKLPNEANWRVLDPDKPEWADLYDWIGDLISMTGVGTSAWAAGKAGAALGATTGHPLGPPVVGTAAAIAGGFGSGAAIERAKQEWLRSKGYPVTPEEADSMVMREAVLGGLAEPIGLLAAPVVKKGAKIAGKMMQAPIQLVGKTTQAIGRTRAKIDAKAIEKYTPKIERRPLPSQDPTTVPPEATRGPVGVSEPPPRPEVPQPGKSAPEGAPAPPVDRPAPMKPGQEQVDLKDMFFQAEMKAREAVRAEHDKTVAAIAQVKQMRREGMINGEQQAGIIDRLWKEDSLYTDAFHKDAHEETMKAAVRMGYKGPEVQKMGFGEPEFHPSMPAEARVPPPKGATQEMSAGRPRGERGEPQGLPGYRHPTKLPQATGKPGKIPDYPGSPAERARSMVDEAIEGGNYRPKVPSPQSILPEAVEMEALKRPGLMERFWTPRYKPHSAYRSLGIPPWMMAASLGATGVTGTYPTALGAAFGAWGSFWVGKALERGVPWIMKTLEKKASPKLLERARRLFGVMTPREVLRALSSDPEFQQVMESEV